MNTDMIQFYIYNLGFRDLFPKLGGAQYPLTQTMEIELGIMAAIALIGGAIQTKVLNMLQKRLRRIREEEEMRAEADEVSKAAERFKNVGAEMAEWEEKHGKGSSGTTKSIGRESTLVPSILDIEKTSDSKANLLSLPYQAVALDSPPLLQGTPTTAWHSVEELSSEIRPPMNDQDLESKLKLLEDVRKARESIRGSLDDLRRMTPTPTLGAATPRAVSPPLSVISDMDPAKLRRNSSASAQILDASSPYTPLARNGSSTSLLDRPRPGPVAFVESQRPTVVTRSPALSLVSAHGSEWDSYVASRTIKSPDLAVPPIGTHSRQPSGHSLLRDFAPRADTTNRLPAARETSERARLDTMAMPPPSLPIRRSATAQPVFESLETLEDTSSPDRQITGSAAGPGYSSLSSSRSSHQLGKALPRTMTYDELSERHRKRLSQLQTPITSKMTEEVAAQQARERWEREKRAEREDMRRKEAEKRNSVRDLQRLSVNQRPPSQEILQKTAEWRQSVQSGLDQAAMPGPKSRHGSSGGMRRGSSYGMIN